MKKLLYTLMAGWVSTSAWAQTVNPPIIPPGAGVLTTNNVWTGTNTYTQVPSFPSQPANRFFAAPNGSSGVPSFRTVVAQDLPHPLLTPYDYGAVGNGSIDDTTAITNWLANIASGGAVRLPCGTFKIVSNIAVTIAAGVHGEIKGDGLDCAIIYVAGAVDGITFNYTNQWSSTRVANLTIASDQTSGAKKCIAFQGSFINAASAYASQNEIYNVALRGLNAFTSGTQYCGIGMYINSISNFNINGLYYNGITSRAGLGLSINGSGTGGTYGVVYNITNSTFNNCDTAIFFGDWVQGVAGAQDNITGCNYGVDTVASPSGILDQLSFVNSQFNTYTFGIRTQPSNFNAIMLTNNIFITNINSTSIKASGTNYSITNNQIAGTTTTGTVGIDLANTTGNGGIIANNSILFFGAGIKTEASALAPVKIQNNLYVGNTADYSINASSAGNQILDTQARVFASLPTCNNAIKFSSFVIADSPTVTYNASVTVGGGANYLNIRCDAARYYVD